MISACQGLGERRDAKAKHRGVLGQKILCRTLAWGMLVNTHLSTPGMCDSKDVNLRCVCNLKCELQDELWTLGIRICQYRFISCNN